MRAPAFWWDERPSAASRLLGPAAAIYAVVADRRLSRPGLAAGLPVVCIGNVSVGGAGKTPAAIAIAAVLRNTGLRPAFLLRGYGGSLPGPLVVDPDRHGPDAVGDEALLLARQGPTIVSRDRPAGAALAAASGAEVLVMDDGLQNPSLAKNLALAVFDGAVGTGNGCVLPAGPLRASMNAQWPKIDAVVIVGRGSRGDAVAADAASRGKPVFRARLLPEPAAVADLQGRRVLAFAGIGRPEKFFATLAELGAEIAARHPFPDHHPYRAGEVSALLDLAENQDLVPVTTAKDAVRLRALVAAEPRMERIRSVPVRLAFDDPDRVATLLRERLPVRA